MKRLFQAVLFCGALAAALLVFNTGTAQAQIPFNGGLGLYGYGYSTPYNYFSPGLGFSYNYAPNYIAPGLGWGYAPYSYSYPSFSSYGSFYRPYNRGWSYGYHPYHHHHHRW